MGDFNTPISADYWTYRYVNLNDQNGTIRSDKALDEIFRDIDSFEYEYVYPAISNDHENFYDAKNGTPVAQFKDMGVIEIIATNAYLAFSDASINALTDPNSVTSFIAETKQLISNIDGQYVRDGIINTIGGNSVFYNLSFGYVITRNLLRQYNANTSTNQIRIGVVFTQESSV